ESPTTVAKALAVRPSRVAARRAALVTTALSERLTGRGCRVISIENIVLDTFLCNRLEPRLLAQLKQRIGFLERRHDLEAARAGVRLMGLELAREFLGLRRADDEDPPVARVDRRLSATLGELAHRHAHRLDLGEIEQAVDRA